MDPQPASPNDVPPPGAALNNDPAPSVAEIPPRRRNGTRTAIEWIVLVVAAVVIALLIKTFLFQAFYIPSGSMLPTLEQNDRVLVNKLSYKLHSVHRGDIVVFTAPKGPDGKPIDPTVKDLVKRVIGLPGETVSEQDGKVYINGNQLPEKYLPPGTVTDARRSATALLREGPARTEGRVLGDGRQPGSSRRTRGSSARSRRARSSAACSSGSGRSISRRSVR